MKENWEKHGCVVFLYHEDVWYFYAMSTPHCVLRVKITHLTILFLSSEDEDDFLSRWGPGDFCNAFTLVSDPGKDAGGVADKPAVEPKFQNR